MSKEYICMCGREFDTKQQLGGHHSHCEIYLTHTGRLHIRQNVDRSNGVKSSQTLKARYQKEKAEKLQAWIDSRPQCETCGKIMTEKFGTGRFCCKACANTRTHSEETKKKIAKSIQKLVLHDMSLLYNQQRVGKIIQQQRERAERIRQRYDVNPKLCVICNRSIAYEHRNRKTCCTECQYKLSGIISRNSAQRKGGNNNVQGVRGTAHYGTYKGIHCDSSFELAFVIYCLEHNIQFERNTQGFDYIYEGENKKYFPDFIINGTYIEIKNYWSEQVQAKIDCFPENLILKTFYKKDLKPCIRYCVDKYGKNFTELYDRNYPSWMDKRDKKNVA